MSYSDTGPWLVSENLMNLDDTEGVDEDVDPPTDVEISGGNWSPRQANGTPVDRVCHRRCHSCRDPTCYLEVPLGQGYTLDFTLPLLAELNFFSFQIPFVTVGPINELLDLQPIRNDTSSMTY